MSKTPLRGAGRTAACGLLLIAGWTHPAGAKPANDTPAGPGKQNQLKQLSLEDLGKVEVTSVSKEPEQVWKTPAAIFVLTQEDIRRSGATSIPELLRLVPGVEVARSNSNSWAVGIRGFGNVLSRSVLVLIDGRSVYTPLYEGVYWDVQNVMLEDVERIEVIRGPGGTIWGANAVNGVINIITKSARNTHGALVSTGGGNLDQATGAARFGGSVGSRFDYRVYGMGFLRGGEYHSNHDPFDEWRIGQMGFRTDWKAGPRDDLTVQGDIYSGDSGERKNITFFNPLSQANLDTHAFVSGGNLLARWSRDTGDGSDIQLQVYFDRTIRQDIQFGETRNTFDVDFIQHTHWLKGQSLIWGLGVRVSPENFIQSQPTVDFEPHHQTVKIFSGFIQDEIPIVRSKLSLVAGTKLENNSFSGFEYQPSIRLLWTPTPHQSFWAAASRAVRTPGRLDQDVAATGFVSAGPPLPTLIELVGNPGFSAERLLGYEAGYRTLVGKRFYVDFATFYNIYRDLEDLGTPSITMPGTPAPQHILITIPLVNGIRGHTVGGEIAPDWKVTEWWHLKGSYSLLHMSLDREPGSGAAGTEVASDLGSSPHHEVVVQSLFNLPKRFEFDASYRYLSALPAQTVHAYHTMDLRIGWHVGEKLEFSVVGQNLLQPFHAEFSSGSGMLVPIRRSAYAKVVWTR